MSPQEDTGLQGPKNEISRRERRLMAIWAAGLVVAYAVVGCFGILQLNGYRDQTKAARQEWMKTITSPAGPVARVATSAPDESPVDVSAGMLVRRIGGFSLKDAEWDADFDIWFRWSGEAIHPGETFEVVNGDVQRREKVDAHVRDGRKYERYHVTARMAKQFDASRFPFADVILDINIQDSPHEGATVRYVADENGSGLDPDGLPRNVRHQRALVAATVQKLAGQQGVLHGPAQDHPGYDMCDPQKTTPCRTVSRPTVPSWPPGRRRS